MLPAGGTRRWAWRRWLAALCSLGLLVAAACSDDDDDDDAVARDEGTTFTADPDGDEVTADDETDESPDAPTTTVPTFTGDADSPFCRLMVAGSERPIQDPFAADLEPHEVELRLRNMRNRVAEFLDVAPDDLHDDVAALIAAVDDVDAALEPYDYDFGAFGADGGQLDALNTPELDAVSFRLEQYNQQVCAADDTAE